jgi:CPA1 family monovalent cation:H+ antiporter
VVVVILSSGILRYIHRPLPYRWQFVLVWGGLRGSLALALALSIPVVINGNEPFADRDLILMMTFGVILFSLLVQGLTIEPLLKRLGLIGRQAAQDEYEIISARKAMLSAAMQEIDKMGRTGGITQDGAQHLKTEYIARIDQLDDALRDLRLLDEDLSLSQSRAIKRRLLQLQKGVVRQRNLDGAISEEPMRQLLAELDEELHELDDSVPGA